MIKKRIKQAFALFALASFIFTFCISVMYFSFDSLYKEIVSSCVAYPSNRFLQVSAEKGGQPPPYSYVNSPKEPYLPYAALLYDSSAASRPPETVPPPNNETDEPALPEGVYPVIPLDMSEGQTENNLFYKNESKYSPDINTLAGSEYPLKYAQNASAPQDSAPIVLIIHTHGTECYLPDGQDTYTADTPTRSVDQSINVIAVGEALASALTENGIPTLHCKTMFDEKSYSKSYDLSEKAVLDYIKQYPSIQYVFDVHRDSIATDNGKAKPVSVVDGLTTAQAMLVVGTDTAGAPHPNWIDNLTVASVFQKALVARYKTLMRPLSLRASSFNAEHTTGSVLIEIGTCCNTISEAKNCAALIGKTISSVILSDGIPPLS